MKTFLKNFIKKHPFIIRLYNRLPFNNRIGGKRGNQLNVQGIMKHCRIQFCGRGNTLEIRKGVRLQNCSFRLSGNNNHIVLDEGVFGKNIDLCTEDNGNRIFVGKNTNFSGHIHLAATEGSAITIGKDCLFSSDIVFRTGDSHAITDLNGNRINPAKDIVLEDHVWVGHRVLIGKGVHIGNDCVVGTGSVVTKAFTETNCVIAGVPAKVVKTNINWNAQR